ncbi:cupredoxin domain-containing protein [Larsenimonas salina]|uniref:cupredoxin domain-containing protein n=1 Tax=Larsenimonas salina TaxID=1295565 RepID=UPI0020745363|nr:cupredoxin domain-containing protein [Larsenimonas salina]MCM5704080.1 cupredoxin domain-containing protein [Larsenimonas salina]
MNPLLLAVLLLGLGVGTAHAAKLPAYTLTLNNGTLEPETLHVKAGERFKIELHNTGNTPVEFESTSMRKEKVMGPGVSSFVVVHPLKPGHYDFFDEFHLPDARGTLIAK